MNKLLTSLLMIGVIAGMAGAGTWAYFSDTETSEGNTFTAGTLDLTPDDSDDPNPYFMELGPMVPSTWYKPLDIDLKNVGTISGSLWMHLGDLVEDGGDFTEPEEELDPLDEVNDVASHIGVIIVYCYPDNVLEVVQGTNTLAEARAALIAAGVPEANIKAVSKLSDLISVEIPLDDKMIPDEGSKLQILVHLQSVYDDYDEDITNLYQGDFATFNMDVHLDQV